MALGIVNLTSRVSTFWPIALGFFGLSTGYLIVGGQALFNRPSGPPADDRSVSIWTFWTSGVMHFMTVFTLIVGLAWFDVFTDAPPLYVIAVAFGAFAVQWFAAAHRRGIGYSSEADGWLAISFACLSVLGVMMCTMVRGIPLAIVFVCLTLAYLTEIPTRFGVFPRGSRVVGLWQVITGTWLMYMSYGVVINLMVGDE